MKKRNFSHYILHEDADFIVINKPPCIATLADRVSTDDHLLALAKAYVPKAQACHRLDKDTSGVLIFAKHAEAYKYLNTQFMQRSVTKIYHAVVEGMQEFKNHTVTAPIYANEKGVARIDFQKGKEAITIFDTIEIFPASELTLISCQLITGRMHQARVHAAQYLHAPMVGDIKYGGNPLFLSQLKKNYRLKKGTEELPLIYRTALHAYQVEYKNQQQKTINYTAEYAKDFAALIKQLNKLNQAMY